MLLLLLKVSLAAMALWPPPLIHIGFADDDAPPLSREICYLMTRAPMIINQMTTISHDGLFI